LAAPFLILESIAQMAPLRRLCWQP
jgi:hypothetical protein